MTTGTSAVTLEVLDAAIAAATGPLSEDEQHLDVERSPAPGERRACEHPGRMTGADKVKMVNRAAVSALQGR